MSTSTTAHRDRPRNWPVPAALIALSAIPLTAGTFRLIQLAGGPELIPADHRFTGFPAALVIHIVGAALFALIGAFQFVPGIRRRHRVWHRRAGSVVVIAGLLVSGSALWLTLFYPAQPGTREVLYVLRLVFGTSTIGCLVLGFTAIRRRDINAHRAWMMRGYALALGAGTQVFTEGIGGALFGTGELRGDLAKGAGWVPTSPSPNGRSVAQHGHDADASPPRPSHPCPTPARRRPLMSTAAPTTYAIRVDGHLDDHWSAWLSNLTINREADGTSTLTGPVADQAQLHGVLAAIRDIGALLLEVRATQATRPQSVLDHPLHTERLTLRPATVEDADPTWKYRQLQEANQWLTGCPKDIDDYRDLFTEPGRLATTVIVQLGHHPGREIIGDFMLRREDAWAQLEVAERAGGAQGELGWVLDLAHAGHGYATEAVTELLRYCFDDLELHRVTANCFLDNHASWRLMERLGMRRETHAVRESLHRSGQWLDTVTYAALADEWKPPPPRR